jgi:hypothetical protein
MKKVIKILVKVFYICLEVTFYAIVLSLLGVGKPNKKK